MAARKKTAKKVATKRARKRAVVTQIVGSDGQVVSEEKPPRRRRTNTRAEKVATARKFFGEPPFSLDHHADAGDVGAIGEAGDLGSNHRDRDK